MSGGGFGSPGYGGGYTNYNASPGQFAGGGGYVPSGMDDGGGGDGAQGRKVKSAGEQQTITPCTIRQLLTTPGSHDDQYRIDGRDTKQVSIVGKVMHVDNQATNITLDVHDGSGLIRVKFWTDGDENEFSANRREHWCQENIYVRVIGHLRSMQDQGRYIMAFHIRPLEEGNEMTHHFLESILVHCQATKGVRSQGQQNAPSYGAPAGRPLAGPASSSTQGGLTTFNGVSLSPCESQVLQIFQNEKHSDSGTHINRVQEILRGRFNPTEISNAVQRLANEAVLYSTVDESSYRITDA
eukprot:tig00020684_g12875.t1